MHTNHVSRERNIIQLHSYIEYFSRNSACFVLLPTIPFDDENFRKARRRASDVWNVQRRWIASVLSTSYKRRCIELKASNFISLNSTLKTERPSRVSTFSKAAISPTMAENLPVDRVKSRPIRGQNCTPIEVTLILSIIIHSDMLLSSRSHDSMLSIDAHCSSFSRNVISISL